MSPCGCAIDNCSLDNHLTIKTLPTHLRRSAADEADETVVVCLIRRVCTNARTSAKRFAQGSSRLRVHLAVSDIPGRNNRVTRSCWTRRGEWIKLADIAGSVRTRTAKRTVGWNEDSMIQPNRISPRAHIGFERPPVSQRYAARYTYHPMEKRAKSHGRC